MGILDSLLWTIDRPQQALFQGVQSGTKQFEKAVHEGYNPFYAFLGSLPSMGVGALEGFSGTGQDMTTQDLLPDLEQHMAYNQNNPEWNKPLADSMRNFIGAVASPADIIAPGGRAAKVPFQTYKNLARMAPEYRQLAMQLGTPLTKAKGALGGIVGDVEGMGSQLRPAMAESRINLTEDLGEATGNIYDKLKGALGDMGGVYSNYVYAPEKVTDLHPMIIRSQEKHILPMVEQLFGGQTGNITEKTAGAFAPIAQWPGQAKNEIGNLLIASAHPDYKNRVMGHETGHLVSNLLKGNKNMLPRHTNYAREKMGSLAPSLVQGRGTRSIPEAVDLRYGAWQGRLPEEHPELAYLKGRVYDPRKVPEEMTADLAGGNYLPSAPAQSRLTAGLNPMVQQMYKKRLGTAHPKAPDDVTQGLRALVENRAFTPEEAWNPWKQQLIQDIPTVPFAQARRTYFGEQY